MVGEYDGVEERVHVWVKDEVEDEVAVLERVYDEECVDECVRGVAVLVIDSVTERDGVRVAGELVHDGVGVRDPKPPNASKEPNCS